MKRKSKRRQRMLTALLCLALCAADIMPVSMTVRASEQMPQSIAEDDSMSEITGEEGNDITVEDPGSDSQEQEADSDREEADADEANNADQDQNNANEGQSDSDNSDDFGNSGDSDDSEGDGDSNGSGNQDGSNGKEDSGNQGDSDDRDDSDDEESDGDLEGGDADSGDNSEEGVEPTEDPGEDEEESDIVTEESEEKVKTISMLQALEAGNTFVLDDVIYEVISEADRTVRIKGIDRANFNSHHTYGVEFTVPASVVSDGITYSVTEIGEFAFADYNYVYDEWSRPSDEYGSDQSMGGTLRIAKVIVSSGITKIGRGAFYKSSLIKEIVLPDTVVEIGEAAFYFNELTRNSSYFEPLTVNIPASVRTIGAYAYHGVHFDYALSIPNGVETIEDYAFECSSEASGIYAVEIPASVKSIGTNTFDIYTLQTAAFYRTDAPFWTSDNDELYYENTMFGYYNTSVDISKGDEPTQLTLYVWESLIDTYYRKLVYFRPSLQVINLSEYAGFKESPIRFLYNGNIITSIELPLYQNETRTITVDTGDGDFQISDIRWSFMLYETDVELTEEEVQSYLSYTVNTDGTVTFVGKKAGSLTVSANVTGYIPVFLDITIMDGMTNDIFLNKVENLSSDDIEKMKQITYPAEFASRFAEIKSKAEEITEDCNSVSEKISAIHVWLTQNIAYDYDSLAYDQWVAHYGNAEGISFSHSPSSAYEVLRNRYAESDGYAALAEAMLRSIGIPCARVSGYGRPGMLYRKDWGDYYDYYFDHAWNMAYDHESGRWIYFDATHDATDDSSWDGVGKVQYNSIASDDVSGRTRFNALDIDMKQLMDDGWKVLNADFGVIEMESSYFPDSSYITLFSGEDVGSSILSGAAGMTFRLADHSGVVEMDADGRIRALKPGTAGIILSGKDSNGDDREETAYVRVLQKETFEFQEAEIKTGTENEVDDFQLVCLLNGEYVNCFTELTSDNPDVVSFGKDGKPEVKSAGTAVITARLFISAAENKPEASCTVTVVEGSWSYSDSQFRYQILSEPSGSKNGTVEIIDTRLGKLNSWNSNMITTLVIPESVTLNGNDYDVIGIGKEGLAKHWEDDDVMGLVSEIVLPDTLQYIDEYAFYGAQACHEKHSVRSTVNIPASLQRIGKGAFGEFQLEGDLIFPEGSQLSYLGDGAFIGNGYLRKVDLSNCSQLKAIGNEAFSSCGYNRFLGEEASLEVKLPEGLTSIGARAFEGDSTLKSIQIPSTVRFIGDEAFMSTGLTGTVNIGGASQIGEGVFLFTEGIETVILSDELDNIPKDLFNGAHKLKNVITKFYYEEADGQIEDGTLLLPTGITSIGDHAFAGTALAGTIDISGVFSIGEGVFNSCGGIETVILPDSLDEIPDYSFGLGDNLKNVLSKSCLDELGGIDHVQDGTVLLSDRIARIGHHAFIGCVYIQSVEARGVKELGEEVFGNCYGLKTISLSDELATIPDRTFWYCRALEGFDFGDGIEEIGTDAFYKCENLGQSTGGAIELGRYIKTIGDSAFGECRSISKVTIYSKVIESIGANCFSSNPVLYVYRLPSGIYERALSGCVSEIIYLSGEDEDGSTEWNATVILPAGNLTYNGHPQRPKPTVIISIDGEEKTIAEGTDYTVSYENNINAGIAKVAIEGMGSCSGMAVSKEFTIDKAELTIQAENVTLVTGESLPETFPYEVIGLVAGEEELVRVTAYSFVDQYGQYVGREDISTSETGIYYVTLHVDAGNNYTVVESRKGKLTIAEERVAYTVTFDMMNHGKDIDPNTGIKAGSLITEPPTPTAEGFIFAGWYKDKTFAAKQKWNFDIDTVQADITLYACWIEKASEDGSGLQLSIQDIQDQYYTGSAIKPTVYVYSADGVTLLKSGKDYTIKYANNIDADGDEERTKGGIGVTETDDSKGFNKDLAYVIITGKGNYSETIYKNFHILPAEISAEDGNGNIVPAAGFTLKYSDQLVLSKTKTQKPFTSLKYKKAMKAGTDYTVTLSAADAYDAGENKIGTGGAAWSVTGSSADKYIPAIPKGYHGTFTMKVEGAGNYTGSFTKTVMVMDKNHLMKNASISLGKNQKSLSYADGKAVTLTPGYCETIKEGTKKKTYYYEVDRSGNCIEEKDAKDIFLVKAGSKYLKYGVDFKLKYTNNTAVGTATMTIEGMGDYMGTKNATFRIKGTAFNTKNVIVKPYDAENQGETGGFMASMTYTGRARTQNKVTLTTKGTNTAPSKTLAYGTHYTISYKNNIKKGTATMTFAAKPESGYTGSFKKTFKITAQSIAAADIIKVLAAQNEGHEQDSVVGLNNTAGNITEYRLNGDIAYVKGGVKPSDRIVLSNSEKITLKEGTDYTVKYKNNTTIPAPGIEDAKKPRMTVTGKGNYTGTLTVFFDIGKAEISEEQIVVTPMALSTKESYEYKPSVKVIDSVSGKALSAGENKDYTLTYENNGQENVTKYVNGDESAVQPMAVVKMPSSGTGSYKPAEGVGEIKVPLPIYKTKLTGSNLYVVVSEEPAQITYTGYSGKKVTPEVTVYYGEAAAISAAKKNKVTDDVVLTRRDGTYRLTKLKEAVKMSDAEPDTSPGIKTDAPQSVTGDYTVTYGANNTAGRNKGSVTITGASREYGGSVTVKFEILRRGVYFTLEL